MFKEVKNETDAYWLGFLYADGCIASKYVLSVALSSRDVEHLRKLGRFLGKGSLHYQHKTNSFRLTVCGKELISNLVSHGVIPRKTYDTSAFVIEHLPADLKRHFIRGLFDGDGTLGVYKNRAQLGFVGRNKALLDAIAQILSPLAKKAKRRLEQRARITC